MTHTPNQKMILFSLFLSFCFSCGLSLGMLFGSADVGFNKIASEVSKERKYEMNVYDCTEFSNRLVEVLTQEGWNASTHTTTINCSLVPEGHCEKFGDQHMIVKVERLYVEAINGEIISPFEYKKYGLIENA